VLSRNTDVLCVHFSISPDFSRRPHQTLRDLFKFRNAIAHGKSQIVTASKEVSVEEDFYNHRPKTFEEEYCNLENAKRAKEDIGDLVRQLHSAAGLGAAPFVSGMNAFSVKLVRARTPVEPSRD